jgi:MFS family permease
MKTYWNLFRQFNKDIKLFLVLWCMIAFAFFGVLGVLMNLYLLRLGFGTDFIGMMHGSGQLIWGIFALPAGMLGMRIGAKRALMIGLLLNVVGVVLLLSSELLPVGDRPTGLIVSWMIAWVGAASVAVNSPPYLMSATNEQNRGFAFSVQQTVMAASGFMGSVAGGFLPGVLAGQMGLALDHPAPYRLALLMAPAVYFLGLIIFSKAGRGGSATIQEEAANGQRAPVAIFLFIALLVGVQAFSEGTVRSFFNIYLDTVFAVPAGQIGTIMGVSSLFLVPISLLAPALLTRLGNRGTTALTTLGMAITVLFLAWSPNTAAAAITYVGMSSMTMIMVIARGIYTQEMVAPRWRTTASAFATIGMALGWSSSAYLGGSLIQAIGFQGLFFLGSAAAALSISFLLLRPKEKKETLVEQNAAL